MGESKMIDTNAIEDLLRQEVKKKIQAELDGFSISDDLARIMLEIAHEKIDGTVTHMLNIMIREGQLKSLIENKLATTMQEKLEAEIKARATGMVSRTDLGTTISNKIEQYVNERMRSASLPDSLIPIKAIDFTGFSWPADRLLPGTIKNFTSTGIEDTAQDVQLTIMDGMIVVEGRTITKDLSVEDLAVINKLVVQDELKIKGKMIIEDPSFASHIRSMINDRILQDKEAAQIDTLGKPVLSNGVMLVSNDTLGPGIAYSNLRKVGNLQELNVIGRISAANTLAAGDGRVGINTEDPSGALSIWDDDAELTIRRHRKKSMYVGSTRDCELVFGTNDRPCMTLRKDGTTAINTMDMSGIRISVSADVPEREGTPGELVIMSRPQDGQPWAYQCLEGKRWSALHR